jgi:hypothetical protein
MIMVNIKRAVFSRDRAVLNANLPNLPRDCVAMGSRSERRDSQAEFESFRMRVLERMGNNPSH